MIDRIVVGYILTRATRLRCSLVELRMLSDHNGVHFLNVPVVLQLYSLYLSFFSEWVEWMYFKYLFNTSPSVFPFSIQSHLSRPSQNCAEDVIHKTKTDQVGQTPHPSSFIRVSAPVSLASVALVFGSFLFVVSPTLPPCHLQQIDVRSSTGLGGLNWDLAVYRST